MDERGHIYVSGRVQGVYYRGYTERTARALGLAGWVMNLGDGRVEAVFEGPRAAVELAILECRKGPTGARVMGVEVEWSAATGEFGGFSIRY